MPLDVVVRVEGANELVGRLGDSQDRQKALILALHKAAQAIKGRAADLAPIRGQYTTGKKGGTLKRSIFAQDLEPLVIAIAPGVNYGGFVELGTRYMSAQPYLFPAAEQSLEQINAVLAEAAAHITAHIGGQA